LKSANLREDANNKEELAWAAASKRGEPEEWLPRLNVYCSGSTIRSHLSQADALRKTLLVSLLDPLKQKTLLIKSPSDLSNENTSAVLKLVKFATADDAELVRLSKILILPPPWASSYSHDEFGCWVELRVQLETQRFRFCPAGSFVMGHPRDAERFRVQVTLTRGFWIADSECTQAFWQEVMKANPSAVKDLKAPVTNVSIANCKEFLRKLNDEIGLNARLPSCAEWEYAARAGTDGLFEGKIDQMAWHNGNSNRVPHMVKTRAANPWGIYDMIGNVEELAADSYVPVDEDGPVIDPIRHQKPTRYNTARGGSCRDESYGVSAYYKIEYNDNVRGDVIGFRMVVSAQSSKTSELSTNTTPIPSIPENVNDKTEPEPLKTANGKLKKREDFDAKLAEANRYL
jgi:hypothetical protein